MRFSLSVCENLSVCILKSAALVLEYIYIYVLRVSAVAVFSFVAHFALVREVWVMPNYLYTQNKTNFYDEISER